MKIKKTIRFFFLPLIITFSANAQNSFHTAKMDSLLNLLQQNDKAMGVLTVAENGKIIYKKAFGYKQVSGKIKNQTDTKFRIGSITKMFTAAMILQLVEEQKLTLQTKLSAYFPEIPNANEITVEQMLTHHSGLYNFTDSTYLSYYTKPKTHQELLAIFAKHTPEFSPGTQAAYSNTNYVLLGYIIEKITGKTYAENLKTRIAKKLNLKNTYVGNTINAKENEAYSYAFNGVNWVKEEETDMSIPGGAGSIVSNTKDLTTFIDALFSGKLISQKSAATMTVIKDGYGMGVFQIPFYDKKAFAHNGGIDGFSSSLAYFPNEHITVALLTNGMSYQMNDIMIGVLSICFDKDYTLPEFKKSMQLGVGLLPRYTGVYASKDFPLKITITQENGQLQAQATGQSNFTLATINENEFRFDAAGIVLLFNIEKDGTVKQFYLQQMGLKYLFEKE